MTGIPRVIVATLEIEDVALERIERRKLIDRWYEVLTDNEAIAVTMVMNGIGIREVGPATGSTHQNGEQHWRNAVKKLIALYDGKIVQKPSPVTIKRSTEAEQFDDVDLGDPELDIEGVA